MEFDKAIQHEGVYFIAKAGVEPAGKTVSFIGAGTTGGGDIRFLHDHKVAGARAVTEIEVITGRTGFMVIRSCQADPGMLIQILINAHLSINSRVFSDRAVLGGSGS